jgi:hypothetical protein
MKKQQKQTNTPSNVNKSLFLFNRMNFYIMIAGLILITIGFFLMIGGGSDDPSVFNEDIFNARRLTLAPILLLLGYGLQIIAIFYKKNEKKIE